MSPLSRREPPPSPRSEISRSSAEAGLYADLSCCRVLGNFKDYEFYTGESMNPDGMIALLNYREDGSTPFL